MYTAVYTARGPHAAVYTGRYTAVYMFVYTAEYTDRRVHGR